MQLFSQWESEFSSAASWQLLFMPLSQRHTLSEGETPMLPDLLSTVKDPVWLKGMLRSGRSFTVHSTVLFSQRQSNLTLVILGRHFSFALGIPAVYYNKKHIPLSNQPLQFCLDNVAVNIISVTFVFFPQYGIPNSRSATFLSLVTPTLVREAVRCHIPFWLDRSKAVLFYFIVILFCTVSPLCDCTVRDAAVGACRFKGKVWNLQFK